jgi:hypothetical protein
MIPSNNLNTYLSIADAIDAPDNRREELKLCNFKQLIGLYKTLPAADISKLQGEVVGTIMATPNKLGDVISWISTHLPFPGNWFGKGYYADQQGKSSISGIGYNRFRFFGKEIRSMRFVTRQDVSAVDGKPVMMMDYKPVGNALGWIKALDEVRQLDENNYLLCGYWFYPLIGRSQFFMYHIYGPIGAYKDPK